MPSRPNVLFVMNDHTNAQALAPQSQCLAPNLDALAGEGVRFGRCYTTNAICSPARASLMTATYPSTHGMWDCAHTQRREWVNVSDRLVYFSQRIVWHDDWKYVFSPGGIDELYDLAADPHERVNLADDPVHRDVLIDLCKRMWRKMKAVGDESLFRTHYATLRTAPIGPGSVEPQP